MTEAVATNNGNVLTGSVGRIMSGRKETDFCRRTTHPTQADIQGGDS